MKDYCGFDPCCDSNPCEPCEPGPCGTPVPPPVRPVVNIPGPNVQAQICELAGRVNECINRWNQIQRNCYAALDRVVGAAVSNDVYYDRNEVGMESGYSENDSCPYHIVKVKCVDKCGKPIFIKLMPAYGNTTNSGMTQDIQDVSFVTNANAIISATTDAPWNGVARYMGAPMVSTPDGAVFCAGFNRNGVLKIFGGDTDEDTLCQNQMVDMIGSVVPIIIDGEITEQAKAMTTKQSICAVGYKSCNGDKVFFNCGKQDVQGMQGITVANILKGMGCTTAVITATAGGGMEYLGSLTSSPDNWQMPKNSAYWVVSKRPFDGWCNQFESSIAQMVQRVGGLKNGINFLNHEVDEVTDTAENAWELAQENADKIAAAEEAIREIEDKLTALEGRIDTAEKDIDSLEAALKQEIQDRKDADTAEAKARQEADAAEAEARQEADAAEAQARQDADTALGERIDQEIKDREAADEKLQTAIDTENAERTAADAVLQGNINQEAIDRANADLKIEQNLNKEIANRTEADQLLQDQINGFTSGDTPLPYVKKAGDTMTGDLVMEGSAVVNLNDGQTVKGSFYRENGDICVKSESGVVRILGATTVLTNVENGAGKLQIGSITIQQHTSDDDVPHLDINVGTDAGSVYINRNGIDGGTGELRLTEIHAPNELRLAPGTTVNVQGHRVTGVAEPTEDSDAANKKYVDEHAGESYVLPVATESILGGIKVGANLTITEEGVLNATGGGGGGGTDYVAGEGIIISGNTISTDPDKVPTKGDLKGYLPLEGGTMTGNIKFDSDADYVGALVADQDHVIMMGSQGEGAIMGSVSAGHNQNQVDAIINANLNSKKAGVQATRTTDGGSSVVIEAQDPDSSSVVSIKVGAKDTDVTGATVGVYKAGADANISIGAGGRISAGANNLLLHGNTGESTSVALNINGADKTATFISCKPKLFDYEAPTDDEDLVPKKYVDDEIAKAGGGGDYLPLKGGTMTGDIDMGQHLLSNAAGISRSTHDNDSGYIAMTNDGAEVRYAGSVLFQARGADSGFLVDMNMHTHKITNLNDPNKDTDAVNKRYVDGLTIKTNKKVLYAGFFAGYGYDRVAICNTGGSDVRVVAACTAFWSGGASTINAAGVVNANTPINTKGFRVSMDSSGNLSCQLSTDEVPFGGYMIVWED